MSLSNTLELMTPLNQVCEIKNKNVPSRGIEIQEKKRKVKIGKKERKKNKIK